MTVPMNRRAGRRPRAVPDEQKAAQLLDEICATDELLHQTAVKRIELALAANEAGLTALRIAEAVGVTSATVGNWIRTARTLREEHSAQNTKIT